METKTKKNLTLVKELVVELTQKNQNMIKGGKKAPGISKDTGGGSGKATSES